MKTCQPINTAIISANAAMFVGIVILGTILEIRQTADAADNPATQPSQQQHDLSTSEIHDLAGKAKASTSVKVKGGYLEELIKINSDVAAQELVDVIKTDVLFVRSGQGHQLNSAPSQAMRKPLLKLLTDETGQTLDPHRILVASLLGRSGEPGASIAIGKAMDAELDRGDIESDISYCEILGTLHDDGAIDSLGKCFDARVGDPRLPVAASESLGNIGTEQSARCLSKQVFSSMYSVDALNALKLLPSELSIPALIESSGNPQLNGGGNARPTTMLKKEWEAFSRVLADRIDSLHQAELSNLNVSEWPSLSVQYVDLNNGLGSGVTEAERLRLRTRLRAWWKGVVKSNNLGSTTKPVAQIAATSDVKTQVDGIIDKLGSPISQHDASNALKELLSIDNDYAANRLCEMLRYNPAGRMDTYKGKSKYSGKSEPAATPNVASSNTADPDYAMQNWVDAWIASSPHDAPFVYIHSPEVFSKPLIKLIADGASLRAKKEEGFGIRLQIRAVTVLATMRDDAATRVVISVLDKEVATFAHNHNPVSKVLINTCCQALGVIHDPSSVQSLSNVIARCSSVGNEPNGQVWTNVGYDGDPPANAIAALGDIRSDESFKALAKNLVKREYHEAALKAITQYKDKRAIGALIEALDATLDRSYIAKAIGSFPNEDPTQLRKEYNAEATKLENDRRAEIFEALVSLGCPAELGSDKSKWQQWWKHNQATLLASTQPA